MPNWQHAVFLCYSLIAYLGNLLLDLFGRRPTDPTAYASVSSFYGPGVYLAWYLVAASILIKRAGDAKNESDRKSGEELPPNDANNESHRRREGDLPSDDAKDESHWMIGGDLLGVFYYVVVAFVWCFVQIFLRNDAELEAGLVILEAAADMIVMYVFLSASWYGWKILAILSLASSVWFHDMLEVLILNYHTPAVITMFLVVAVTSVWYGNTLIPDGIGKRRLLVLAYLTTLWLGNGIGTYHPMPRAGEHLVALDELLVLDQLAPLCGAVVSVVWSWKTELYKLLDSVGVIVEDWMRNRRATRVGTYGGS
jgi:hypothetical protein